MPDHLTITHIGQRGDGVAETSAGPVYIPYTLPGETVEVEPDAAHPDRARLLKVEAASAERIAPFCPHFGHCGGCAIQHWVEDRYVDWKRGLVLTALSQTGIATDGVGSLLNAH